MSNYVVIIAVLTAALVIIVCQPQVEGPTVATKIANANSQKLQSAFANFIEMKKKLHNQIIQNVSSAISNGGILVAKGVKNASDIAHNGFLSFLISMMTTFNGVREIGSQTMNSLGGTSMNAPTIQIT